MGCMILWVEKLRDFCVWRGCVIFLTHSHDLFFWRLRNFFAERLHDFFVERLCDFFVESLRDFLWRGCMIFFGGEVA